MVHYDLPVRVRLRPDIKEPGEQSDPVREAVDYVHNHWFEPLLAVKSRCFRCHADSPVVYVPYGTPAFGDKSVLSKVKNSYFSRDITKEAIKAFADVGWKMQRGRSYCPTCKGLGST
jgi:hypothetical protein